MEDNGTEKAVGARRGEKEKNAQNEATRNQGEEDRIQVAVVVEIVRRRQVSLTPVTRDGKDRDLGIWDSEEMVTAKGLEVS